MRVGADSKTDFEQQRRVTMRVVTRRFLFIIAFVLAGAIINIVGAWASAAWLDGLGMTPPTAVTASRGAAWSFSVYCRPFSTIVVSVPIDQIPPTRPHADASKVEVFDYEGQRLQWEAWHSAQSKHPVGLPPYWSRARMPAPSDARPKISYFEDARGWPLRSLMATTTSVVDTRTGAGIPLKRHWQIRLHGQQDPVQGGPHWLPLRPIWPGFIANTLIFATGLWLLVAAPFQIRRVRRKRQGLCVKCGYDLRGRDGASQSQICPECGAGTSPSSLGTRLG